MTEVKIWNKFYECCCGGEGIMMSYDNYEEGLASIDLAFFQHGLAGRHPLGFWQRFRWAWFLIKTGRPFLDEVVLNQNIAKKLGEDLVKFSEKKYKFETKEGDRNGN